MEFGIQEPTLGLKETGGDGVVCEDGHFEGCFAVVFFVGFVGGYWFDFGSDDFFDLVVAE